MVPILSFTALPFLMRSSFPAGTRLRRATAARIATVTIPLRLSLCSLHPLECGCLRSAAGTRFRRTSVGGGVTIRGDIVDLRAATFLGKKFCCHRSRVTGSCLGRIVVGPTTALVGMSVLLCGRLGDLPLRFGVRYDFE